MDYAAAVMACAGRWTAALALAAALSVGSAARADDWVWDDRDPTTPPTRNHTQLRVHARTGLWLGTFDRTLAGCRAIPTVIGIAPRPGVAFLRTSQIGGFCDTEASFELGLGVGAEVAFRAIGPLHFTAAAYFLYTFPDRDFELTNQIVVPLPLGVRLTMPEWAVRPVVSAQVTPILFLSDGAKDYTFGLGGGLEWPLYGENDMSFTMSYETRERLELWRFEVGLVR
jgi:hypothetical protein